MSQLLIYRDKVVDVVENTFEVHADMMWVEGIGAVGDSYVDGQVVSATRPSAPSLAWDEQRREDYRKAFTLGDQLDIIQKQLSDMVAKGEITVTTETQGWLDTIASIKLNNPQPE